ncbi:hypothetical protein ACJX0J_034508, partial [Zea mays]
CCKIHLKIHNAHYAKRRYSKTLNNYYTFLAKLMLVVITLNTGTKTSLTKGSNCPVNLSIFFWDIYLLDIFFLNYCNLYQLIYILQILAIAYNLLYILVTDDLIVVQYAEYFILIPFYFDNLSFLSFLGDPNLKVLGY